MIVTRNINGIEIDVNINSGNELNLDEKVYEQLNQTDILSVKEFLYRQRSEYLPLSVTWELTNSCNFGCSFCYINSPKKKHVPYKDFEFYKALIQDLVEHGMLFCTLTGGECLLHPHFHKIYQQLKERGVIVSVFTNGSLIDHKTMDLFSRFPPYKVEISIYGISQKQFQDVTHAPASLKDAVFSHVIGLKNLGIQVICKTPLNQLTASDYEKIESWCKENNIPFYSSTELLDTYYGDSVQEFALPQDIIAMYEKKKYARYAKQTNLQFGVRKPLDCSGGKYACVISFDDHLQPCMAAYGHSELQVSIDHGIEMALKEYQQILAKYKDKTLSYCKGCIYSDVCEMCVLQELDGVEKAKEQCFHFQKAIQETIQT